MVGIPPSNATVVADVLLLGQVRGGLPRALGSGLRTRGLFEARRVRLDAARHSHNAIYNGDYSSPARVASMTASPLQTFKAQFFRALAHPGRIRILEILVRGD